MDDLIEAALLGLEYRNDITPKPRSVQCVVVGDSQVILLFDYWWRLSPPMLGTDFYVMQNHPTYDPVEDVWRFDTESNEVLTPPADEDSAGRFQAMREAMRVEFSDYMLAYETLQNYFGGTDSEFDFMPWFSQVQELGELDPIVEYKREAHGRRPVAYARVVAPDGTPVDAAVFDDFGNATSVLSDGPLAGYVAAFQAHGPETRPSAGQYAEWLKNQSLYGPYAIDHVGATETEGDVETIASRALTLSI